MASLPNLKTVTYEEWLRMPEVSDGIEEVVNGEVRITSAPSWNHSEIVQNVCDSIRAQINRRNVRVACSRFGLIIRREPLTTREPDLAVFLTSSIVEQDGYIHSAPQLVVEVLSPADTRRERERKLQDYAALGVPEIWVVSPEGRTVEVLYLEDGQLRRNAILADGILRPRLFPDVQVAISEIWPD
jgi:Uma2 family endonuclease